MDSTPNNGKLLFDVGGTFLKAVIADGNGRFVPDTEYSVPMPSDGPREEIEQALIAAVERGGAKFWELVPAQGKKNLADAPILKCLEEE